MARRGNTSFGRRRRTALGALTTAVMALPFAIGAQPALAQTDDPPAPSAFTAKSEGELLDQFAKRADGAKVAFWVTMKDSADLSAAKKAKSKTAKARAVRAAETAFAKESQAGVIADAKAAGAKYKSFWISNTVKITGTEALAEKLAARSDVAALEADTPVEIPDPIASDTEPPVSGVEWNVDRINAPKVWHELGIKGEDIVVANIDTGAQYDHPALKAKYRGLKPDGTYDHNYNFFDPANVCAGDTPCDNHGHGTHTMGTMVGDDGGANQIGVAPAAKWIAAKGCESGSCSRDSLLASGQWVVAPTDLTGANPRPELAPDVVNNSWGANVIDTWYKDTVQSWRNAGIFPAFSNGNAGPGCNTAGSPGAYVNSYASGAFDVNNNIASFSSRGTGESGTIKPNIAAPGVNVRSSVAGGGYGSNSGTSMASPHTAAAVALMWSASPAIRGDIAETEKLLNQTAIDVDATTCGGTAANNNVFGEGRLDAFAAVSATPRGALGALAGKVTSGGNALADAAVALDGPMKTTKTTGSDGSFTWPKLMVGDYKVTVTKFGYLTGTGDLTVTEGQTTSRDFTVDPAPSAVLKGKVSSDGGPEAGASLVVQGTPVTATAAADGAYEMTLPVGTYNVAVTPTGKCASATSVTVELAADKTQDIQLPNRADAFGHTCRLSSGGDFPTGETKLTLSSTTTAQARIDFPFPVPLYGKAYRAATATTEGSLNFGTTSTSSLNGSLPSTSTPNGSLYPFWDNMTVDAEAGIYWAARGTAPHRQIVVEWRNVYFSSASANRVTFAAVISEDGSVSYHYKDIGTGTYEGGEGATIGVENETGTEAFLYSLNQKTVTDGMSIAFRTTKSGVVTGTVTDANDGMAVGGGTVTVAKDGATVGSGTTAADGQYLVSVPAGTDAADHAVSLTAAHYSTVSATRSVKAGGIEVADAVLTTGVVSADTEKYELVLPAEQSRIRSLTLANAGSAAPYQVAEKDGAGWVESSVASGSLKAGASQKVTLTFDTTGATPGSVLTGTLFVTSESGRNPVVEIPLKVVVPAYQAALEAGAAAQQVDALGDTWAGDQAYAAGSYGYLGNSTALTTGKSIAGTDEQQLYRTARQGAYEYRFDNLPDGVYQVELGFAELTAKDPAKRVFDVMAEGTERVSNLDLVLEAGTLTAHDRTFTVTVTDGQLNLRLVAVTGKTLVNKVRISHRPDLSS
ncbi:S8 family serine peptidase [Streptomyces sp. NPDC001970]